VRPAPPTPDVVLADRGYDHDKYRRLVRELGIRPLIARRNTAQAVRPQPTTKE
jgi:hypothetical protein